MTQISDMVGKTFASVVVDQLQERVEFRADDGKLFLFYHDQDCCESVTIKDVAGDINDLIGSPLYLAEEATNVKGCGPTDDDSFTWTFYKFATVKGFVTISWYGASNGYYSESVTLAGPDEA